jgi:CheY-like chemotaxis protein
MIACSARPNPLETTVILIVEDEAIIRIATAALLEEAGYIVVEARDADVAIQILESRNDIRAVFTDIRMPGSLDGLRLAHAVRYRWPSIHLLVTSGLSALIDEEFPRYARFLRKPYAPKYLLKAFADLFSQNPDPIRYIHNVVQICGKDA